jgi:hypothetical protein
MNGKVTREDFLEYAKHNDELFSLERRVLDYRRQHKRIDSVNVVWYSIFKREVCALVGWSASVPELKSSEAYDVVYEYLYRLLSDRNFPLSINKQIGG